jgi:hypothetical protein
MPHSYSASAKKEGCGRIKPSTSHILLSDHKVKAEFEKQRVRERFGLEQGFLGGNKPKNGFAYGKTIFQNCKAVFTNCHTSISTYIARGK